MALQATDLLPLETRCIFEKLELNFTRCLDKLPRFKVLL
jgi:hypothetical protein